MLYHCREEHRREGVHEVDAQAHLVALRGMIQRRAEVQREPMTQAAQPVEHPWVAAVGAHDETVDGASIRPVCAFKRMPSVVDMQPRRMSSADEHTVLVGVRVMEIVHDAPGMEGIDERQEQSVADHIRQQIAACKAAMAAVMGYDKKLQHA